MITREEFNTLIWDKVKQYPKRWREGQKVFNAAEEVLFEKTNEQHNIAREVQFDDRVDCFFDDEKINEFLNKCWVRFEKYSTEKEHL